MFYWGKMLNSWTNLVTNLFTNLCTKKNRVARVHLLGKKIVWREKGKGKGWKRVELQKKWGVSSPRYCSFVDFFKGQTRETTQFLYRVFTVIFIIYILFRCDHINSNLAQKKGKGIGQVSFISPPFQSGFWGRYCSTGSDD